MSFEEKIADIKAFIESRREERLSRKTPAATGGKEDHLAGSPLGRVLRELREIGSSGIESEQRSPETKPEVSDEERRSVEIGICDGCGEPLSEGARFCGFCGAPVEGRRTATRCAECGRESSPGARFCGGCGARIDGDKSSDM